MRTVEWKLVCRIDGKIVDMERDVDASAMEEIGNDVCNGVSRGTVEMCDPEIVLEASAETIRMVLDAGNKVFDGKKIEAKDTKDWSNFSASEADYIKGIPLSEGKDIRIVTIAEKLSELAKMLDGIDYLEIDGSEKMTEAVKFAKENNLLVIFGYSDDLLEMCGVFREEFGAWNGCIVTGGECKIDVRWCDGEESAWSYHLTNCGEHEKFCIMEDGELYSYGIVILDPGVEWKGEDEDD